jgi:hypothetical protein
MKNEKHPSWLRRLLVGLLSSLVAIIALPLVAILVLNIGKYVIYYDYYQIRDIVCTNYGLYSNYVSQGTAITDDGKYLITSGYMSDGTNSRIYITNIENDSTHYVNLNLSLDTKCTYHVGGVATANGYIYIASNDTVFYISLEDALKTDTMVIHKYFEVNNQASFIFVDDNYIYVGEFNDNNAYKTNNEVTYNGVTYKAIVEKYPLIAPIAPVAVYAIRDKVQGFAMNENGDILLSTSFGLSSSNFYYYKSSSVINTQTTYNGLTPLYVLEKEDKKLVGPAMSEDLDYYNGKFYTNFESACNKYIYGKFFLESNKIVALDFSKIVK